MKQGRPAVLPSRHADSHLPHATQAAHPGSFAEMNRLAETGTPFIFLIDYHCRDMVVLPLQDIDPADLLFDFNGVTNAPPPRAIEKIPVLHKKPMPFDRYLRSFRHIVKNQEAGNSYLANLTFPTEIGTDLALDDLFHLSSARYRLLYRERFVVFSPEKFVTIEDGVISSFPMKGTIDASLPDAAERILADEKEAAEHLTIVDLIRNDLNMVADGVTVERYRYAEKIRTGGKDLLQVSSEISGRVKPGLAGRPGDLFRMILPAGSVTGAPKMKTVELIVEAEGYDRGFYTGVCGICHGDRIDSGVMIRFIEKIDDRLYFKSGGGITVYSDPESEYQEMIDKVNVPVD